MKHIEKGDSPEFFEEWKGENDPTVWNALQNPQKGDLRKHLLEEQGYLCCYCNQGIIDHPLRTKIEHFYPKDQDKYPEKMFEYSNLLLSCNGGERDAPPRTLHCDSKKGGDEPSPISPLKSDCADFFQYGSNGKMGGTNTDATTTITDLGLDIEKLKILRKTAINNYFELFVDEADEEELAGLLEDLEEKVDGKFAPFCKAIQYVLKELYS